MKNIIIVLLIVVVCTVDGAYVAYDNSDDSAIVTTVHGVDVAVQEVAASPPSVSSTVIIVSLGVFNGNNYNAYIGLTGADWYDGTSWYEVERIQN